ncbi:MAG TPA: helix-turn-helix domain-containing protein [Reyranella sp.]|nr:helix-turn-helix domain-containing protein [Reyranella sp.]
MPGRVPPIREEHRDLIAQKLGRAAGNGHRILEHLYRRPIVSVKDVMALTGTSFVAANGLVGRMADAGILVETTGRARHRRFRYDAYVDLFTEQALPSG